MIKRTLKYAAIIFIFLLNSSVFAQMDCASTIKYRYTDPPFVFNEQSKSAICYSGQKYEYDIYLLSNIEYRFSFFASSVFNNNIRFKIINKSTGELLLDLPGEAAGNNTSAILQDYYDKKQNKFVHPYYDINPEKDSQYKVIVEVGDLKQSNELSNSVVKINPDQLKGCVTIFLQSKNADQYGF
jgi:hypothetical protein